MTKLLVIDLDQTVIDSSIRENLSYNANNTLSLTKYHIAKNCPDMGIVNDTLTPFGTWLNNNYFALLDKEYIIIFLTARLCDKRDFDSFKALGIDSMLLDHCLLIERGISSLYGGNEKEQDSGKYKKPILWYLANAYQAQSITVIDDCKKVLDMAKGQGFKTICARELYHYEPQEFSNLLL